MHPSHTRDVLPALTNLLLHNAQEMCVTIGPGQWLSRFRLVAPFIMYRRAFRIRKKVGLSVVQVVGSLIWKYIEIVAWVIRTGAGLVLGRL